MPPCTQLGCKSLEAHPAIHQTPPSSAPPWFPNTHPTPVSTSRVSYTYHHRSSDLQIHTSTNNSTSPQQPIHKRPLHALLLLDQNRQYLNRRLEPQSLSPLPPPHPRYTNARTILRRKVEMAEDFLMEGKIFLVDCTQQIRINGKKQRRRPQWKQPAVSRKGRHKFSEGKDSGTP